jgi:hypothetical protein
MTGNKPQYPFPFGGISLEYLASEAFEMLKEAGDVAEKALDRIAAGDYDAAAWSRTVADLYGISLTRYAECARKFTGQADDSPSQSVELKVPVDKENARKLEIVSMARVGIPSMTVPGHLVSFDPPVLAAGETSFDICVDDADYTGYTYVARVYLHKLGINPSAPVGQTIELYVPL